MKALPAMKGRREFTNISVNPVDMTGWSYDDDHALAGAFDLSAFGTVQPGESVVLCEATAAGFRTAWNLIAAVKVIGGLGSTGIGGNNLARNDEINLFGADDVLVDRLTFGDQTYTGTIRTQNFSGQAVCSNLGQDDVHGWVRSVIADQFASTAGDVGTPGRYLTCSAATASTSTTTASSPTPRTSIRSSASSAADPACSLPCNQRPRVCPGALFLRDPARDESPTAAPDTALPDQGRDAAPPQPGICPASPPVCDTFSHSSLHPLAPPGPHANFAHARPLAPLSLRLSPGSSDYFRA
ncbi:MAG: lamin tail domain-containing protein [Phycisphaerales bacterium]